MRKKQKMKKKNAVLIILIFSIIGFGLGTGGLFVYNKYFKTTIDNGPVYTPPVIEEKVYEASLIAVGDNLIHSSLYKDANRHANGGYLDFNTKKFDFRPMYKYIKEIVQEYDIGYINQETILGGTSLGLSDYPTFNSPFEVGDAVIDAGFNLVSLATNHTVDRGKNAVMKSCEYWNKQEGVMTSGSYCSEEKRNEIKIAEVNNITYTMLNYTYGTNGMPVSDDYLVNVWPTNSSMKPENNTQYQNYKEQVKKDIDSVRDKVDVLIVAMHWGTEYTHVPTAYEKDMANYLASLDVDIIIGTHPHVIQPVTWIDDTLVIYSLGNFISAQYQNQGSCSNYKCTVGLMTSLRIEKTVYGDEVTIKVDTVENELIYNYYNQSTWRGFVVIPFSNSEIVKYLPNYKKVYETYKKIVQNMDSTMYVKEMYSEQ